MKNYFIPIHYAIIIFPLIALLFTIPYIIYLYRKYGSISFLRTFIVYSFILYLIIAYFLVILPLPDSNEVAKYTTPIIQIIPFNFIIDIIENSSLVITDIHTYLKAFKESYIYNVIFNFFLLIPFGVYMRYYFKYDFKKTVLFSFLLSLFFEITQLTGLYFIYPRPYRLFDVDDLIINTLGGAFGYYITPLFSLILPSRDKLDFNSYKKGKTVSYFRRFVALIIDLVIISILQSIITIIIDLPTKILSLILIFSYFIGLTYFFKGQTIGKKIVKIKLISQNNKSIKLYQYFLRYLFLYIVLLIPIINNYLFSRNIGVLSYIIIIPLNLITLIYYFIMFIKILSGKKNLFYERISNTTNISTIKLDNIEEI